MNGNNNNAIVRPNKPVPKNPDEKKADKAAKRAAKSGSGQHHTITVGKSVKTGAPARNDPGGRFEYVIGSSERLLWDYLACIFDPWTRAGRVPCRVGGFELTTRTWCTRNAGVAYANALGDSFIAVAAANWCESGNADGIPDTRCGLLATGGNGSASYSTSPTTVATAFADTTQDIDAGWSALPMDNPMDNGFVYTDRIRLVAMGLKIRQTTADQVAAGEVMLVGSVNPLGGIGGGSINGATWDQLLKTNDEVMVHAIKQIPGWEADDEFTIVAIPGEQQCFEMVQVLTGQPTVGNPGAGAGTLQRKFPVFHLGAVARGMTAGQKLTYEVVYRWESEISKTNSTEVLAGKSAAKIPQSTLDMATAHARPLAHSQVANTHVVPFVQTLASTNPSLVHGLGKHPDLHASVRPNKKPLPMLPTYVDVNEGGGFLDKIAGVGKGIINAAAKGGFLKNIPVVGNALDSVANIVSGWFS